MYLVEIFLPLADSNGEAFSSQHFDRVKRDLAEKFGGVTVHSQPTAEGIWTEGDSTIKDQIIIYEVLVKQIERPWWQSFREQQQRTFRQDKILIRASSIEL